ncbi:uncharacterized protein LOC115269870 [Aedes albopictus]|uniref:DUF7775 domain-containing protein n=1 Tax=Aedes albopictus TaxID=7160 RepID=A0ABM1ZAQ7_AEDAL
MSTVPQARANTPSTPEEELAREKQALLGLKFLEATWSMICVGIRVFASQDKSEPLSNEMFFGGVFLGFAIISALSFVITCRLGKVNYVADAVLSLLGLLAFVVCGFKAMYYVENDIHLRFLTDKQEKSHKFFIVSRLESIFSMQTAGLFLVHGMLMLDTMGWLGKPRRNISRISIEGENHHKGLRLNPFWSAPIGILKSVFYKPCRRV